PKVSPICGRTGSMASIESALTAMSAAMSATNSRNPIVPAGGFASASRTRTSLWSSGKKEADQHTRGTGHDVSVRGTWSARRGGGGQSPRAAVTRPAVQRRPLLYIALLALLPAGTMLPRIASAGEPAPRGIVLVVGDGMGSAHFTLARLLRGADYRIGTMPEVGLVATHAVDTLVTDSAAAATAFATGVKTVKGAIGTDPSGAPVETVLEAAEARGLATGLVTTTVFVDATPAAFAAHAQSRAELGVIAQHMLSRGIEVIAGTGLER